MNKTMTTGQAIKAIIKLSNTYDVILEASSLEYLFVTFTAEPMEKEQFVKFVENFFKLEDNYYA
jgi:hypothetical protein